MKHGKKYVEAAKLVNRATFYEPNEAIALVKKTAVAKFDETIEVPPSANYFAFGINSYYGTTIYVDDCWVTNVAN